jgi:hypothetical protein
MQRLEHDYSMIEAGGERNAQKDNLYLMSQPELRAK